MNESGIYPAANRVLIKPDPIEDSVTSENIVIPEQVKAKYEVGQATGVLVDAGPDAFLHTVTRTYDFPNGKKRLIGESRAGYSEPFAEIGDRIAFAKFSGQRFKGQDGVKYVLTNDEDITGKVSDKVELSDLNTRKGVGL